MITSHKISLGHVVSQTEGHILSDMDGEKVMLSIANGKYYNLGDVGSDIWELMHKPILISNLITDLLDQFDISRKECEAQVLSFLQHLLENGLIQLTEKEN